MSSMYRTSKRDRKKAGMTTHYKLQQHRHDDSFNTL